MVSGKRSESEEFKDWLHRNKEHFKTLNPTEIAERAIIVGFSLVDVRQWEIRERFQRSLRKVS